MKRTTILLVALVLFFCLPHLGFADCTEIGNFDNFRVQDDGSIIFYTGNAALGKVQLQDCTAGPASDIRLPGLSVCDGDEIMVDGQKCTILSLTVGG